VAANGGNIPVKVNLNEINKSFKKGSEVGTISVRSDGAQISVPAVLDSKISRPPFWWRLFHP
jgi:hypothetical protein